MRAPKIIAKMFNKDRHEIGSLTSDEVVIEALCAYRDDILLSDEWDTSLNQARLAIIAIEIGNALDRIQKK